VAVSISVSGAVTAPADFEFVFVEHRTSAFRLARVLCDSESDAEDLVADAFARLYRRWQRGSVDDVSAYLRATIVNGARSRWRRRDVAKRSAPRIAEVASVGDGNEQVGDAERVRRALIELPLQMRSVVALRVLEDLSEADTARLLGVSSGTVKTQLSRGMQRLRTALEDDDE
jgi:RNA polymerase sigma-70 factor (sigma-E family)